MLGTSAHAAAVSRVLLRARCRVGGFEASSGVLSRSRGLSWPQHAGRSTPTLVAVRSCGGTDPRTRLGTGREHGAYLLVGTVASVDSRQRLVQAMSGLLWERGYADTSPRHVLQRAGLGHGSLYHHFATKRDLALAAIERNIADLTTAPARSEQGEDPLAVMEEYLTRPRDALKGCKVGRLTQDAQVREDPVLRAPVARAFEEAHGRWAELLRAAAAAGRCRSDLDPDRLAYTLMAVLQGGYVLAMARQDAGPFEEAVAGAVDLLRAASVGGASETTG